MGGAYNYATVVAELDTHSNNEQSKKAWSTTTLQIFGLHSPLNWTKHEHNSMVNLWINKVGTRTLFLSQIIPYGVLL